ncbi:MAG: arylesterase [Hydrogenophilales bacterium 16-64-46]|nr:MAG: arylesterase [Hydrogenophilales bacterium 12-64-13]OYZ05101.1 MAG: arylesterase [Hydrogenophilales bacterium 16-64-46]OZA37919.1 MAG: arylesterase [Hydrogenophilales bacterium 17-64-34]HQT00551.1 arylesterase [Thiobacillus sp.]
MNYRVGLLWVLLMPGWAYAAQCSMLIVGDSLSSGYGLASGASWVDRLNARLKKTAPAWQAVNASVSGDTTQNGLQRLKPALARQRPEGVVIELGGNDALRGTPPQVIRNNLRSMIRQAKTAGAWVLLLDAPVLPNYGRAYAEAVAKIYVDLAREEKVARVPCFVCGVGVKAGMMQADGIHPNEKAQATMLDAVWPVLKPKLRCTAP